MSMPTLAPAAATVAVALLVHYRHQITAGQISYGDTETDEQHVALCDDLIAALRGKDIAVTDYMLELAVTVLNEEIAEVRSGTVNYGDPAADEKALGYLGEAIDALRAVAA